MDMTWVTITQAMFIVLDEVNTGEVSDFLIFRRMFSVLGNDNGYILHYLINAKKHLNIRR